jgi:hypothetical protein
MGFCGKLEGYPDRGSYFFRPRQDKRQIRLCDLHSSSRIPGDRSERGQPIAHILYFVKCGRIYLREFIQSGEVVNKRYIIPCTYQYGLQVFLRRLLAMVGDYFQLDRSSGRKNPCR